MPDLLITIITFSAIIGFGPAPTSTPRPASTVAPTPVNKFTQEQLYKFTEDYGRQYKIDPAVLRHIAVCESGFRPQAKNGIYAGLFQFSPATWKSWRSNMNEDTDIELRYQGEEAIQTAAYVLSLGKGHIWPNCMP